MRRFRGAPTRTWYQCTACGQVVDTPVESCPNCGGVGSFEKREGELEPDRMSSRRGADGARELTPDQIRETIAAHLAEDAGIPQRPIP